MLSIIKNHHNNAHTIFFFTLQRITILIQILSADFMFSFVSWLHVQLYLPLFCVWFQGYPLVVCLPGGYSQGGVCHSRSRNRSRWRCLCYNYKEIIVLLVKEWPCAIVIYWTLGTLKKNEYVNIFCMYMRILLPEIFFLQIFWQSFKYCKKKKHAEIMIINVRNENIKITKNCLLRANIKNFLIFGFKTWKTNCTYWYDSYFCT